MNFTTNFCPDNANTSMVAGKQYGYAQNSACCTQLNLPVASYVSSSVLAAPLRSAIGYSLFGVQIYGPMENGFVLGQACTNSKGVCAAGYDVITCGAALEQQCGTAYMSWGVLPDDCGGHASPYHYHYGMKCDYNANDSSGHSPLVGLMLDGRGLYGEWESEGTLPTDLDACMGHSHAVPATTKNGATFAAFTGYHYHLTPGDPTTVGCFGPGTVAAAKAAYQSSYSTCGPTTTSLCTSKGVINYLVDCPIGLDGLVFTPTPACPNCQGNCSTPVPGGGGNSAASALHLSIMLILVFFGAMGVTAW